MTLVIVGSYTVVVLLLTFGLLRLRRSLPLTDDRCPAVSVVVTARNEARDLPRCLAALATLDFPRDLLQIVLVNDRSTDDTGRLIDDFASRHPNVLALHTQALPDNGLEAKARGLAHGIARATGDWVLITDADAEVRPGWIRHLLAGVDDRTGLVGGAVGVVPNGPVGVIEQASWTFVQLFSAGAAGLGVPFICLGPNMGIRRSAYVAAGGLERAPFRVAEDLALTQMIARAGLRASVVLDPPSTVTIVPVPSFSHLIGQQRRWMAGGFEQGRALRLALFVLFGWGFVAAVWFLTAWSIAPGEWAAAIGLRAAVDATALSVFARRAAAGPIVRYLAVVEAYTVAVFAFLPLSLLLAPRIGWRGNGYAVRYEQ